MNPLQSILLAASVTLTAATQAATTPPQSHPGMNSAAPLQVSAIDHVGINVPDIDTATRFFSALMGARVVSDISPGKIPDQWKNQFRWHGSSELQRFVMLQMDGGAKLELFQYQGSEVNQVQPHGDDAGASHVALRTADIDGSLATLKRLKVTILNDPITNTDGVRWFYFQAPWGTQIELVSLRQSVGG
ncbi:MULTISPECIES: VOC family protein [Pseudomonas]|uniref:Glyoxalase n=1 Tax=Pseudomonas fluorescens TaxID=294 RepID=A0A0N9X2M3_PSEFL|nr:MULTISPECIES: VOC family protein [Pseudomonas]ALI09475.1 glyoxalase [Pseudomonas fluorescens]